MRIRAVLLTTLSVIVVNSPAFAVDSKTGSVEDSSGFEEPKLSSEKRALIIELLKTTDAEKRVDQVVAQMMAAHARQYPAMIEQLANADKSISDEQRKTIVEKAKESSQRSSERLRELFLQKIKMGEIMDKVALYVYDKNFTELELKDLIAFYKTPTGMKALKQMPEVLKESMDMTAQLVAPQMGQILTQLMDEERSRMKGGADEGAAEKSVEKPAQDSNK